jgi:hypothetical protein
MVRCGQRTYEELMLGSHAQFVIALLGERILPDKIQAGENVQRIIDKRSIIKKSPQIPFYPGLVQLKEL